MAAGSAVRRRCGGFTLVATLLLVALVALSLAAAGPLWSQQVKRERERELLRIGRAYAAALADYHRMSPGERKQFPDSIEALLLDTRFVGTVRHLRRAYGDPVNARQPWGVLRDESGRIVGVHSLSTEAPLAQGPVALPDRVLPAATRYADWKFLALVTP